MSRIKSVVDDFDVSGKDEYDRAADWDLESSKALPTSLTKKPVSADLDAADLFGEVESVVDSIMTDENKLAAESAWQEVSESGAVQSQQVSDKTLAEWIEYFDHKYFVSFHGSQFVVYHEIFIDGRASLARYADTGFIKFHANKVVFHSTPQNKPQYLEAARLWLKRTSKRYEQLVFDPSDQHDPKHYNLWRGFGVTPIPFDPESIKLITDDLIRDALCSGNKENADYVLNWLAHGVQNPATKPGVALVLRGLEGTGKGTLGRALLQIWGGHGITVSHTKHLTGNFNNHLRNAVFVFSDEASFVGDAAGNQVLRALITEDLGVFESKGIDADLRKNFLKVMMATNSDWAVNVGKDARRYFVLDVSDCMRVDPKNPVNRKFWDKINSYLKTTGAAEFLDYLLKRDITGFVPAIFPLTQALARQRALSLPPIHAFFRHCLETGEIGGTGWSSTGVSIAISEMNDILVKFCNDHRLRTQELTAPKLGVELKKFGVDKVRRRGDGNQRSHHYVFPPRVEFAKTFVEALDLPADDLLEADDTNE